MARRVAIRPGFDIEQRNRLFRQSCTAKKDVVMRALSLFLGIFALVAFSGNTRAQSPQAVQLGILKCHGGADIGFIVGSVTHLRCVLTGAGRPDQSYVATIQKIGLDIGITEDTNLLWAVFAPVNYKGPADLSGHYAGAEGDATFVVGLGANVLVGGSQNSIALQPLSVQSSAGIDVSAGLESLDLQPGR
jgi:hypothetical protein